MKFFDSNRVRYRLTTMEEKKSYDWLFFSGGPGADSGYLQSLIEILDLPGNVWLIDMPGNGDNMDGIPADYNFDSWLTIFPSIIKKFENPILVGHSFGGMFPLLFPELELRLRGLIILNSAPSLWLEEAVAYSKQFHLPDLTAEMQTFTQNPTQETFKVALDACMPYYFPHNTLEKGRALFSEIPFQFLPAVWWQRKVADMNFSAKWVPQNVQTLIIGGTHDCIVPFTLFQRDKRFARQNIKLVQIENAGHCSWIDNPEAIKETFRDFRSTLPVTF